jgi:hypothetical protein
VIGEIKKEGEKGKKGVPDSLDFGLCQLKIYGN